MSKRGDYEPIPKNSLMYLDLLAALMILVGMAFINWMDTGCAPGNC